MTDTDRNIRTLIVCFVLALFTLVPMRIIEGDSVAVMREVQVLGETDAEEGEKVELIYSDELLIDEDYEVIEEESEDNEVILPDAEVIETEE